MHNCNAEHADSVPVKDTFDGQTVWEGVVEVFNVNHRKAQWCYAWEIPGPEPQYVAVLGVIPVMDPISAVRAFIVSQSKTPGTTPDAPDKHPQS